MIGEGRGRSAWRRRVLFVRIERETGREAMELKAEEGGDANGVVAVCGGAI